MMILQVDKNYRFKEEKSNLEKILKFQAGRLSIGRDFIKN